MKLLHTADWHLGKSIYGRSLLPDQKYFIEEQFLPLVESERPAAVLLSGDVFDRPIAPVEAIRVFDRFLTAMHALNVPLLVISGNHDGAERMSVGAGLLRQSGVYIAADLADVFRPAKFQSDGETLCVTMLPYCEPAQIRAFLGRDGLRGFQESYAALLYEVRKTLDPGAVNVLMAHCFVAGGTISASESPVYVGGAGDVSAQVFQGFDYVALGHLHAPQRAGENGWYAGSPLKYSFDEAGQKKSVSLLEFHGRERELKQVSLSPRHDLRVLSGCFDDLLRQGKAAPSRDYLYANLQDNAPVYLPMDRMREYFPNLLGLSSRWLNTAGSAENADLREQLMRRKTDDAVIFETFLRQVCGQQADETDRALFLQALRDCGEQAE